MKSFLIGFYCSLYNVFAKRVPATRTMPSDPMAAFAASFDAIWILTIPRNLQRQEFIRRELKGLPFEFFTGIDGQSLTRDDPRLDLEECERRNRRTVKTNEIACTLSHLVMYQRILDEGLQKVLIFEDDAVFDTRKARWVSHILERLPEDWELVYWGYRDGELRGPWFELLEFFGKKRKPFPVVSRAVHQGLRTAAGHDFTHAYAITNEGARKLLEDAYPVKQTADGHLEEYVLAGKLRAYAAVPKIFLQQEDLGSSIHNRTGNQKS